MLKVEQIEDVDEIIHKWPRLLTLAETECVIVTHEELLQIYLHSLSNGAVFAVYGDSGLMGACCVVIEPPYVRLVSLPSSRGGTTPIDLACIEAVEQWCKQLGMVGIKAMTHKLNGSSLAYFGQRLGFRKESVTFVKQVE